MGTRRLAAATNPGRVSLNAGTRLALVVRSDARSEASTPLLASSRLAGPEEATSEALVDGTLSHPKACLCAVTITTRMSGWVLERACLRGRGDVLVWTWVDPAEQHGGAAVGKCLLGGGQEPGSRYGTPSH